MRSAASLLVLLAGLLLVPAAALAEPSGVVTIRRGPEGTPHIRATTWEGMGYGFARAHATDNLCALANMYVTVRGERSRYFGPTARYAIENTGTKPHNLQSDLFWARVAKDRVVEDLMSRTGVHAPAPPIRAVVRGYTEGYNDVVREGKVRDPACAGEPWVKPIEEIDVWRRFYQLATLASSMIAVDGIGGAQPPTPDLGRAQDARAALAEIPPNVVRERFEPRGVGSNAIALGRAATENGRGLLLGNPHQPWTGTERFYQSQLTIPGKLNVSGASLYGVPAVNIGFTRGLAWSHTVSTARRFVISELRLVPGSPTSYVVDGETREMRRTEVTVQTRRDDGTLEPVTRTLYSTDLGPVLTSLQELPVLPWTPLNAYVMFDANAENYGRLLNHFFGVDRTQSVPDLDALLRRYQGVPWVNTIAADRAGNAYYADIGSVPGVPDAKIASCSAALGVALDELARVQVLDGSRAACAPDSDPSAPSPHILGADSQPSLRRDDYTLNSNDSHWLSNAQTRLEGFPRIIGEERTQRSLRTRMALRIVEDQLRDGGRFSLTTLREAMFNNRVMSAELWRDELVAMCRADASIPPAACDVLAQWSTRDDLDARGALLFRRFAQRALDAPSPFRVPFDPDDPVGTPHGLNTNDPSVRQALRDAIDDLEAAGVSFDARLSELQYETRGKRIPLHGGPSETGVFNVLQTSFDPARGYTGVTAGQTYIQAVGFRAADRGCPVKAYTVLGHSLSTNPKSPWFANGTEQIARKEWVKQPFCAGEVRRMTKLTEVYGRVLRAVRRSGGRVRFRLAAPARVTVRIVRRGKTVRRRVVRRGAGRHSIGVGSKGKVRVSARAI